MTKKIGCLHAHHSNIPYVQTALGAIGLELSHFVDPGLIARMSGDRSFDLRQAQDRAREQVEWIARTNVDAILITCTNYIALLDGERLDVGVPVVNLDEPFFARACEIDGPQTILFTNPATVEGTMRRLHAYAESRGLAIRAEALVVPHTFQLIMRGEAETYKREVSRYIRELLASDPGKPVSVAQLSMVEAAEAVERDLGASICNPLKPLAEAVLAAIGAE
ncbi:hypothetical protein [Cohnella sp. GCM10027633]|uniref:hypothetical protein n=1 Tax=unclassified Cohnella TaxID=2636738 RepID=UPI00363ACF3D